MRDNIPAGSVIITFDYAGIKGQFHVWPTSVLDSYDGAFSYTSPALGCRYQWSALGNCGEEVSQEKAIEAARKWIRSSITKTEQ